MGWTHCISLLRGTAITEEELGEHGTTVVLITWAGSVSSYEYFNMGKLKQEFDNATCSESLALILSIYFASQIEFSIKKERYGRENPNCSSISSPFPFVLSLLPPLPISISLSHYRITVGIFLGLLKEFLCYCLIYTDVDISLHCTAVCNSINIVYGYQCVASSCW